MFFKKKDPQQETTSSSSETSPGSMTRKPKSSYLSRKTGKSSQNLSKRHVRSSSGYSSHNEETTFRWKKSFSWNSNNCFITFLIFLQLQHIELSKLRITYAATGPLSRHWWQKNNWQLTKNSSQCKASSRSISNQRIEKSIKIIQ